MNEHIYMGGRLNDAVERSGVLTNQGGREVAGGGAGLGGVVSRVHPEKCHTTNVHHCNTHYEKYSTKPYAPLVQTRIESTKPYNTTTHSQIIQRNKNKKRTKTSLQQYKSPSKFPLKT